MKYIVLSKCLFDEMVKIEKERRAGEKGRREGREAKEGYIEKNRTKARAYAHA